MASRASKDLIHLCRELKAPSLLASLDRLAHRARDESWPYEEFLAACLEREVAARQTHGGEARIKAARFPQIKKLEVQERAVQRWASPNGPDVFFTTTDAGVSGTKEAADRPGLTEALNLIEKGAVDGLVVAKLDRLARTPAVQEAVLERMEARGTVFTVDTGEVLQDDPDDPMRTAMRQMMGVFAQLEPATIAARMKAGRRLKVERGGYGGGKPPVGFRCEGKQLIPDEREQEALRKIREYRASGLSLRAIATTLMNEGYSPRSSSQWTPGAPGPIVGRMT